MKPETAERMKRLRGRYAGVCHVAIQRLNPIEMAEITAQGLIGLCAKEISVVLVEDVHATPQDKQIMVRTADGLMHDITSTLIRAVRTKTPHMLGDFLVSESDVDNLAFDEVTP